ncbi:MAG: PadR family transcriptional regulator [Acidimicrobiales bacterium]
MQRGWSEGAPARRPRGDMRAAVLALLDEVPMHAYQMIQEISGRSGGRWKPGAGSIYPVLQLLEDEALATAQRSPEGKRLFELTQAGRDEAARLAERSHRKPWELPGQGSSGKPRDPLVAMTETARVLLAATGRANDEQKAQITALLDELREQVTAIVPERKQGSPFASWARSQRPSGSDWPFNILGSIFGGEGPFAGSGARRPRPTADDKQDPNHGDEAVADDPTQVVEGETTDV